MKQYTTPEQTAKLIELGFEMPKSEVKAEQAGDCAWCNPAYSIGELIEMLPARFLAHGMDYRRVFIEEGCFYLDQKSGLCIRGFVESENLIDNIFCAIVEYKNNTLR